MLQYWLELSKKKKKKAMPIDRVDGKSDSNDKGSSVIERPNQIVYVSDLSNQKRQVWLSKDMAR